MKTVCFKFTLDQGFEHRDFAKSLADNDFDANQDTGFELIAVSSKRITGVFYSKRMRKLNLTMLSGEVETVARETIERVEFDINLYKSILVITDPKLERARFVSRLISCAKFRVTLEPLYNEVSQFAELLTSCGCRFEVTCVVVANIDLLKGVEARVAACGTLDRESLSGRIGKLKGRLVRFDIRLEAEGRKYQEQDIRVYSGGRIEFIKAADKQSAMLSYSRLGLV